MASSALLSRIGIAAVVALTAGLVGAVPAMADDVGPTVSVIPAPVCVGHDFVISGAGQVPGTYALTIQDAALADLTAAVPEPVVVSGDGSFSAALTARADAPTDTYQATFTPADPSAGAAFTASVPTASCPVASDIPTVIGTAAVGRTVSAATGSWEEGASLTYEWRADGVALAGRTSPTLGLTGDLADKVISVAVTGTKEGRDAVTQVSAETPKVIVAGAPSISGSPVTGSTLTAKPGAWTASSTFHYQWKASGTPISGATSSTFKPTATQDGKRITVTVTGTKTGYATASTTSSATAPVLRTATPKISGYAAVGLTLKAAHGTWSANTAFTYRWYANGVAIPTATASSYKLTSSQRDKRITVKVTGKKSGYPTATTTSASTAKVTLAGHVSITGTPVYGGTLTAHHGTWASGTTFSYQWYQNGVAIGGATKSTLHLGSGQKSKNISVHVTGRKSGYATVVKSSASTLKVATVAKPTITGTKQVGKTLTAHHGTWTTGTTFSYQWYAAGKAITGAKSATLKLSGATKGKRITVKVTGRKSGYPTVSKTSSPTAVVAAAPSCDPNYTGACVPIASDVDCAGGSGNGPAYVRGPVYVVGVDIYDLDRDGDGVGCEG